MNNLPHPLIAQAIAKREAAGLKLTLRNRALRPDDFVCYPKDEATKQAWVKSMTARGWSVIQD